MSHPNLLPPYTYEEICEKFRFVSKWPLKLPSLVSFPTLFRSCTISNRFTTDYLAIRNIWFAWAECYDSKDWKRLETIIAPISRLDFRSLQGELNEGLTPEQFATSVKGMIADDAIKTQHFLGGDEWARLGEDQIRVKHQLRVAHQRYSDATLAKVVNKGHAHGYTTLWFRKVDGKWKIEGCRPQLEWFEYDLFGTLDPSKASEEKAE